VEKEKLDKYNIDSDVIREYFQLEHILKNMFEYFGGLLGLTFKETKSNCWHSEVREFLVYNADVYYESKSGSEHSGVNTGIGVKEEKSTLDQSSIPIGKVYFDLFPRPNKFTHAACFPLKFSTKADAFAVCAIVCNFTPATDAQTALLTHDEVETFYHEFGHAMHGICSSTYYLEFSGTQTDRDFVEMPSQMVENWCWEFNTLKRLGKHYKTGDPIPDDMIAKLIATRYVGSGLFNCRQLCFAMSDILLHTRYIESEKDMLRIYDTLMEEVLGIPNLIGTHRLSTFGHIAGGYDAQYYGYMWSKVYADDIYLHIKHEAGIENNHSGHSIFNKQYRAILEAGGSIDAFKLIKRFLGREPSTKAFLRNLGL
jgi:thimet oligopeptidase